MNGLSLLLSQNYEFLLKRLTDDLNILNMSFLFSDKSRLKAFKLI